MSKYWPENNISRFELIREENNYRVSVLVVELYGDSICFTIALWRGNSDVVQSRSFVLASLSGFSKTGTEQFDDFLGWWLLFSGVPGN